MTAPSENWKLAVPDIAGHSIIAARSGAPMVAFSPLNLPVKAQDYLAQLDVDQIRNTAIRARGGRGSYVEVGRWHADPTRSTDARQTLANRLNIVFPDGSGKRDLIDHMTGKFAELASAWNREKLVFETRGDHSKKDIAHADYGAEFVAIANLTNRSTLFAPPHSYAGQQPRIYTPEGVDGNIRYEYHMTPEMQKALEGVPEQSLASWRGSHMPAIHLVPEFEGTRAIMLANTLPHSRPALI